MAYLPSGHSGDAQHRLQRQGQISKEAAGRRSMSRADKRQ